MQKFNRRVAVGLTRAVGSMWMAYAFTLLALAGLPSALHPGGEGLVAWIAQTFLQLVLLSVIMVGQDVQSQSTEARDLETHDAVMAELAILKEEQKELKELAGARDLGTHGAVTVELGALQEIQKELKKLASVLGNGRLHNG